MITFDPTVLAETEARFKQRQQKRAKTQKLIAERRILEANPPDLVERRIARLQADPVVVKAIRSEGLAFERTGPGFSARSFPRALERVLGTNNLIGIGFLEQGLAAARSVALIHLVTPQGTGYGTGFMVSPRLLLTNNHVLPAPDWAARSRVEFNFQLSPGNVRAPSESFELAPDEFFLTDPGLDYTLVAVQAHPELAKYGWLKLIAETGKLLVGEWVNIIQHPNGEPKQLAIRDNQVLDELELFLHYQADTAPGSSGSPVFNDQWEVVALHHSGVPDRDGDTIKTIDGQAWRPELGEQRIAWIANEGVRVSRLVAHIAHQDLNPAQARLRAELLELEPPKPNGSPPPARGPASTPARVEVARDVDAKATAIPPAEPGLRVFLDRDGRATWTLPLTITVSLGQAATTPPATGPELAAEGRFGRPGAAAPAWTAADFRRDSLTGTGFDWPAALSLAVASKLAYSDRFTVEATARRLGFTHCRFFQDGATECFLARDRDRVVVAFRGTQGLNDWLSNLDLFPTQRDYGRVHAGFFEQFDAVRQDVEAELDGGAPPRIFLTGHSLGGAIATIAAAEWAGRGTVTAVYTFGQPAVGNGDFAKFMAGHYGSAFFRFVNDADVVARVPPGYTHFGRLFHFDAEGNLPSSARESTFSASTEPPEPMTLAEFDALQDRLRRVEVEEAVGTLISDHDMDRYLEKIRRYARPAGTD